MGVPITYNVRNLVQRKTTTLMTALGIALTVAVLTVSLALTAGLKAVLAASGHPRQFLVLRTGVDSETNSTVADDAYQIVRRLPGIATDATGEPLAAQEGMTIVNLPSVDAPAGMNVSVRGVTPVGVGMRNVAMLAGRTITPGLRQIIVGKNVERRYPSAKLGGEIRFGRGMWQVVGVFDAGESAFNSEVWADLNQLRGDFESSGGSNSVLVRANSVADLETLRKTINDDQRLNAHVLNETEYYAAQTQGGAFLQVLGTSIAIIMAIGSAFAATNTMYAAVARRTREIGTLRALGFTKGAILRSFILESMLLAMLGGGIGILMTLPMNNITTGVGNFSTFSEIAFNFRVTPQAMIISMIFATVIGALGGFLPARAAARKDIIQAMREI
jgi:ABC-type lipoprotein release transport system permease subunit